MSNCRVDIGADNLIDLQVDRQHISRITHREARELVLMLLIFGGKEFREDIQGLLNGKKIETVADVLAPEKVESQP